MGALATALGQLKEGQTAEAQGKLSKQIALRNQRSLERQAKAELDAANIQEGRVRRQEKLVKGAAIAGQGKSGGQIAGASLSALTDIAAQFSIERNLTLRGGLIRGRELRERGQIIAAQGKFAKTLGRQAKRLSFIKAGGTLLTSLASSGQLSGGGGGGGPNAFTVDAKMA